MFSSYIFLYRREDLVTELKYVSWSFNYVFKAVTLGSAIKVKF